jgi:hypothetical protein
MDTHLKSLTTVLFLLNAVSVFSAYAQKSTDTNSNSSTNDSSGSSLYFYTTKAYQNEASRSLIEEVNLVAKDLNLPEQLPITESNLVELDIAPPGSGMLGMLSTSNYTYYVRSRRKFAGLDQRNQVETFYEAKAKYLWPISRMNTNSAFQVATQIMATAGMDVTALNRDLTIRTSAPTYEGRLGKTFVPSYRTSWFKGGENIASVEFLEPTRTIRTLQVYDSKYILRKPVNVPNLRELLIQGNAPKILLEKMGLEPTNAPSYRNAPLETNVPSPASAPSVK